MYINLVYLLKAFAVQAVLPDVVSTLFSQIQLSPKANNYFLSVWVRWPTNPDFLTKALILLKGS